MQNHGLNNTPAWKGIVHYFSGGTSSKLKKISYTSQRWARSVGVKKMFLEHHGVGAQSRVVICYPYAPWSIGSIFTEASLHCEANVFPIGNHCFHPTLLKEIQAFKPTHICASARQLLKLYEELNTLDITLDPCCNITAFVAGELLDPSVKCDVERQYNTKVVNVYGMAEFDMVGGEYPDSLGITLVSEFDYRIKPINGELTHLSTGLSGELYIMDPTVGEWYPTNDTVRVINPFIGAPNHTIQIMGRTIESLTLSDGTTILGKSLESLVQSHPDLSHVQLAVSGSTQGDQLELRCVKKTAKSLLDRHMLLQEFLASNLDLADSYKSGIVTQIKVSFVTEHQLSMTSRGKVPRLIKL